MRLAGVSAALMLATVLLMIASTTQSARAQTFTTLHTFDSTTDGSFPEAGLVQARDGNLYGTTSRDGSSGGGTVFRITPGGTLTTLYNFCANCIGGSGPYAGLIQASDGNFYGTTAFGGNLNCDGGCGTIFKMTPGGTLTTLYNFCPQTGCADGDSPSAVLMQASDGDFYGTAGIGGIDNKGTVFKITLSGTLTILHSFTGTDGANPNAGLVQATDGNFYGTASDGGANGDGTVHKITPSGTFTTVHTFDDAEGAFPAGLVQASNGKLYGTTYSAGPGFNGTVFEINSAGALTTLHSFAGPDGSSPYAGLVQGSNGTFYGTTSFGGANSEGTIFGITASGLLTVLYSFCSQSSCADGGWPTAPLVQRTDGSFYGTASIGGVNLSGTVFRLSVGLHPFVETQPSFGKAGAKVLILGNKLTGVSEVTFNGITAPFSVLSKSEIITTVPTGATSGTVEVTTSSGTLKSNTKFRVTP
jgi:uncharacterized repeat protein (TIGR03803 family)